MKRNRYTLLAGSSVLLIVAAVTGSTVAAEAPSAMMCDQLGREIALRAAEQPGSGINAGNRSVLADIASQACLDYQALPAATPESAVPAAVPGTGNAPVSAPQAAPEEEADGGLFDIEIIQPEDRVRRPGLKRR